MILNIQSLNSNIELLRSFIKDHPKPPLILCLVECQIAKNTSSQMKLHDYNHMYISAATSTLNPSIYKSIKGGGTMVYYHQSITAKYIPQLSLQRLKGLDASSKRAADPDYGRTSSIHYLDFSFNHTSTKVRIGIAYLSPGTLHSDQAMNELNQNIITACNHDEHVPLLIGGDFNLRCNVWDKNIARSTTAQHFRWAPTFYDTLVAEGSLTLLNTSFVNSRYKPTHLSNNRTDSVLDLCFANDRALDLVRDFSIIDYVFADHLPLTVDLAFDPVQSLTLPDELAGRWSIRAHSDWKSTLASVCDELLQTSNSFTQAYSNLINNTPANQEHAQTLIQSAWSCFMDQLNESLSRCVPMVSGIKRYHWYTAEVQNQHDIIQMFRKRWRRGRLGRSADVHLARYREQQKIFKRMVKQAKAKSFENLYQSILQHPQSPLLWTAMARIRPSKSRLVLGSIPDSFGNPPANQSQSLDNLCSRFISNSRPSRPIDPQLKAKLDRYVEHRSNYHTPNHISDNWSWSADQIEQQCHWQRNTKSAAGPDGIPPIILRHLPSSAYSFLADVFNFSWRHSVLPIEWVSGNIFALLKDPTKPIEDPTNYRPITVTSIFIRTFEHLIHRNLSPLIHDPTGSISPIHYHQFGFREAHSCQNAIHLIVSTIQGEQNASFPTPTPAAFIDFRQAFDKVQHAHLLFSLEVNFHITGQAWRWKHRWLNHNRRTRCVALGISSKWHKLDDASVPQGAVLSPILFIVFINPIIDKISRSCPLIDIGMYADDLSLFPKPSSAFQHIWSHSSCAKDQSQLEIAYSKMTQKTAKSKQTSINKFRLIREIAIAKQMQRALTMLSAWLNMVGMSANPNKSKLVVFSSANINDHEWLSPNSQSWYRSLVLDGFTLDLTTEYVYLGVTLQCQLKWESHITKLIKKASDVSSMLCRLFIRKNQQPHPLAVIKLVKALIYPVIEYGIEFWYNLTPSQSSANAVDHLNATILKPIRKAFNIQLNSHRLGLLVDCGLVSVHDLAMKAMYRYYTKYANPDLHSKPEITRIAGQSSKLHALKPPKNVHPSTLRILKDAFCLTKITTNSLTKTTRWSNVSCRARFVIEPHLSKLLDQAKTDPVLFNLPCVKQHVSIPPLPDKPPTLNTQRPIERNNLSQVAQLATFEQWKAQFKSTNPTHIRGTQSPLTTIRVSPGIATFLKYITNRTVIHTLMRLRHGRAFTQDARFRFQTSYRQVSDDYCKHPPCLSNKTSDSAVHLLTRCPAHTQIKQQLLSGWKQLKIGRGLTDVVSINLKLMLGEPPSNPSTTTHDQYIQWYEHLTNFYIHLCKNLPTTEEWPLTL